MFLGAGGYENNPVGLHCGVGSDYYMRGRRLHKEGRLLKLNGTCLTGDLQQLKIARARDHGGGGRGGARRTLTATTPTRNQREMDMQAKAVVAGSMGCLIEEARAATSPSTNQSTTICAGAAASRTNGL
jgi:hypothetical protein